MRRLQTHGAEVFAIVAMALTLSASWWLSRPEVSVGNAPLGGLPLAIGNEWVGEKLEIPREQLDVLRATDVVLRRYRSLDSDSAGSPAVFLFAAYYRSQRTGATYHSPRNCLPGSGWQIVEQGVVGVPLSDRGIQVNEAVIQNGLKRQLMLFWYQDRGRILTSEYSAKLYLIWDSLTQNRSDGALVRVSVAVADDVAPARRLAIRFVQAMWEPLSEQLAGTPSPTGLAVRPRFAERLTR